jgi:tRNA(Ile)-lysidine synthase
MIKAVKQVLPKDRKYHVAVSMGADSVAALFWMRWKGYEVTPMHFNHNLRAQNCTMQERFLALCETLGLEGKSGVWAKGFGTEAECREARLDFYSREAKGATIVTAHHLDDWVESYLLNCFRGHPNKNPFELESRFPDFTVVHPFLPTGKRDFKEFLERNGWAHWVVRDETNSSTSGSRRNWIRHNILPEMARQKLSLEKYARRRIKRLAESAKPC